MGDDLIERAREGQDDAWRELYESLTGRLVVWLRTRPSGDASTDAEDLAAQSWLVAAHSIADFQGDRDAFAGWLFTIARNQAANVRRRSMRRATDPVAVDAHPAIWGTHEPVIGGVEGTDWVRSVLARLPPREGEVLACMEVADLDTAQTARVLSISTTAVRVARHRGLARLRQISPER